MRRISDYSCFCLVKPTLLSIASHFLYVYKGKATYINNLTRLCTFISLPHVFLWGQVNSNDNLKNLKMKSWLEKAQRNDMIFFSEPCSVSTLLNPGEYRNFKFAPNLSSSYHSTFRIVRYGFYCYQELHDKIYGLI